ncbi:MAG: superoxide dismutase [Ignavibacteria bacterium]|nr:superoxide dismutase [Ignavibacteria bacterium]
MKYELPALPFPIDSLAPHISAETLEYHHGKHHAAYVNNLNNLVEGTDFAGKSLEEIIKSAQGPIFNNAAQIWNHTFFWDSLSPNSGGTPTGKVADAIANSFGSFDVFKDKFSKAATSLFGAGWTWLVKTESGSLDIISTSNAGNPLTEGKSPILTIDVWEHAYYIDYRNARPKFIEHFWELVNWENVLKGL